MPRGQQQLYSNSINRPTHTQQTPSRSKRARSAGGFQFLAEGPAVFSPKVYRICVGARWIVDNTKQPSKAAERSRENISGERARERERENKWVGVPDSIGRKS
jgi:hypothetical protein